MQNKFGGYLPFEMSVSNEYHRYNDNQIQRLNSGRAAIFQALMNFKASKIYIPHYICKTVIDVIEKLGLKIERYFLDEKFCPIDIIPKKGDCLFIVNYFGIFPPNINQYIKLFDYIIIDNTQAFFQEPIFKDGVYNIYSCRKFIGVADGGYLIANNLKPTELKSSYSYDRMEFLFKCIDMDINQAYGDSKANEMHFRENNKLMSNVTNAILRSVDYEFIKKRRMENFDFLDLKLNKYNKIKLNKPVEFVPYGYPYFPENEIRNKLVQNHLYVPTLWEETLDNKYEGKFEYELSQKLCLLPIDQRYNTSDMEVIIRMLEKAGGIK